MLTTRALSLWRKCENRITERERVSAKERERVDGLIQFSSFLIK